MNSAGAPVLTAASTAASLSAKMTSTAVPMLMFRVVRNSPPGAGERGALDTARSRPEAGERESGERMNHDDVVLMHDAPDRHVDETAGDDRDRQRDRGRGLICSLARQPA
jgi:hypothetical protein